jgi:DNA-binding transcriptional regulator/RsmH inhibitor MraZ
MPAIKKKIDACDKKRRIYLTPRDMSVLGRKIGSKVIVILSRSGKEIIILPQAEYSLCVGMIIRFLPDEEVRNMDRILHATAFSEKIRRGRRLLVPKVIFKKE